MQTIRKQGSREQRQEDKEAISMVESKEGENRHLFLPASKVSRCSIDLELFLYVAKNAINCLLLKKDSSLLSNNHINIQI